ncbi:MAG: ABC transporter permease [Polyangiaceae bacterium]
MKGFFPIWKRELFALFATPLFWVLAVVFLFVQGLHFYVIVDQFASASAMPTDQTPLQAFFGNTSIFYLVLFLVIPPLTMRTFAEERRSGTIETLVTAPVSDVAVVLAKYAAVLVTYVAMWLPTVLYLFVLRRAGGVDFRIAGAAYLGVLLVGAGYLSVGTFASAATRSPFVALLVTAFVLLVLFVMGLSEFVVREGTLAHDVASHVSVWSQMAEFSSGIVDSRRLVFDGTLIVFPLYLAIAVVRGWKEGTG